MAIRGEPGGSTTTPVKNASKPVTIQTDPLPAGAIVLGKLSTHDSRIGGPSFDLPWPPARNPWNTGHHPGGSSSGSGSGLAAGLFPMALGSDTGGSVRNPASACGIVGLKPTYGLVSRRGSSHSPLLSTMLGR
jgi:Asp-tRNA(Asn)/Glu-tRNA(Gln) amidotransferase A subunit family amidase